MTPDTLSRHLEEAEKDPGQKAVLDADGNIAMVAPPGTGKTRGLTVFLARDLRDTVREPAGAACITYSNECARELKARLAAYGVRQQQNLFIGTIHAWCLLNVVLPYGRLAGVDWLPERPQVASSRQVTVAMEAACQQHNMRLDKETRRAIESRRIQWVDRSAPAARDRLHEVVEAMELRLHSDGLLDFQDMVVIARDVIYRQPEVRRILGARFPVLVVDEYQDLGRGLHDIVVRLASEPGVRVVAAGDPMQSLYAWAGAEPELFETLWTEHGFARVPLTRNYRTAPELLAHLREWCPELQQVEAMAPAGGTVVYKELPRGMDEENFVANSLLGYVEDDLGVGLEKLGVLCPTNEQAIAVERAVRAARPDLAVARRGAARFFEKNPLWMWLEKSAAWVISQSSARPDSMVEVFDEWRWLFSGIQEDDLRRDWRAIAAWLADSSGAGDLLAWLNAFRESVAAQSRLDDPMFSQYVKDFDDTMADRRAEIEARGLKVVELAHGHVDSNRLLVSTIHSAKGLEFDAIILLATNWIAGSLGEGALPYGYDSGKDSMNLVGLSRPRRALIVVYPQRPQSR